MCYAVRQSYLRENSPKAFVAQAGRISDEDDLVHADATTYPKNGFLGETGIELANSFHRSAIPLGNAGEGVSVADGMVLLGCSLRPGAGSGILLGLFLGRDTVFLVGPEDFVFVIHILDITLVGIEIPAAHFQKAVP